MEMLLISYNISPHECVRNCNVYGAQCDAPGLCDVYLEGLCAGKASVYLSKRINSSLLTKIFIS